MLPKHPNLSFLQVVEELIVVAFAVTLHVFPLFSPCIWSVRVLCRGPRRTFITDRD